MTDERDAADALGDAIDEIHRLEAELIELRALKAKVDGCERDNDIVVRLPDRTWAWATAGALLAWLRGDSDD